MSTHRAETSGGKEAGIRSKVKQAVSMLDKRRRDGTLAMLAGSVMLASTVKNLRQDRRKAALQALTGVALLGLGRRQHRAKRREDRVETEEDVRRTEEGEKAVSDEAYAEATKDIGAGRNADESQSVYQSETEPNPRGMSDRSDVQEDDGGDIDFVEGKEPAEHQETHLEEEHDTRLDSEEDEPTEIDLSEAAMADEVSEAVGPQPEQAYPAREGTDPEPLSEGAPPRVNEGAVSGEQDTEDDQTDSSEEQDTGGDSADDEPEGDDQTDSSEEQDTEADDEPRDESDEPEKST